MLDLAEFTRQAELKKQSHRERLQEVRAFTEQAAVRVDKLTQDPEWNFYLTLIQPDLDQATRAMESARDALPGCVEESKRLHALIQYWYQRGVVAGLERATSYPATLKERAASVTSSTPSASSPPEVAVDSPHREE